MKKSLKIAAGTAIDLKKVISYAKGGVVSKTVIDKKGGTLTLFAFDKGQGLSEHTAPFDAVVELLEGEGDFVIGGKKVNVPAGTLIIMPARVPHSISARKRFKMLLTMIRA